MRRQGRDDWPVSFPLDFGAYPAQTGSYCGGVGTFIYKFQMLTPGTDALHWPGNYARFLTDIPAGPVWQDRSVISLLTVPIELLVALRWQPFCPMSACA